jgi:hypothetical protein
MRCFFHLVNGNDMLLDDTGVEVPNLDMAKVYARQAIRELRQDTDEPIEDWNGWQLDIVCPEGTLLHSIPLTVTLH